MKKSFITGLFIPLTCSANTSTIGDGMPLIVKIAIGVVFFLIIVIIGIYVDTKRNINKEKEQRDNKEKKSNNNKIINNNIDLKKDKKDLEEKIRDLEEKIRDLEKKNKMKDEMVSSLQKELSEFKSSTQTKVETSKRDEQEEECNKADNPNTNRVDGQLLYNDLSVINGNLVKAEPNDTIYYCSWKRKGKIFFKFVNNERTRKAINNRTIIIDPFCIKQEGSKSPDLSEKIETVVPGQLNDDYTILKKAEIIYK